MDTYERFHILSLDGGGIKGLFSAALLAKIEESLDGISIVDHFDLITGTSTGGIIALGLGAGLRPREIVQFYASEGPTIFRKKPIWTSAKAWFRNKYAQEPLKASLQRYFQDKLLAESNKRLVIPSYNLAKDEVYVFKTPHHPRLTTDGRVPMWKVALATSAAPTYFPCCDHVDSMRLVDGGLWANNPTMVGIVEAVSLLGVPLEAISTFSLGTTNSVGKNLRSLDRGGFWQWRQKGIDAALRGQSHGVQGQAQLLLSKERAVRLDPIVPDGLFALDKLSEKELLAEAAHEARKFAPMFSAIFAGHQAKTVSFQTKAAA
ncbi:putative sporulation hydrolase CotR [Crateriforma conspicua]|uniref:Putative sporulation hydrolase CotR n=1 Tax=Crateriforma conspicua TaxID=2527996 RepID=A0A5C6FN01_9PLAN|nr:CBASS cGAMP-activated phospholipase [Crateriforma conspicua]TWU64532.1 putative sporulation hydrolase CotR [Crateriforma conspicua]